MENILSEDYEMKDTYSKSKYKQSPREGEIEGVFGQYGEEIPPAVLRYMRKNPQKIIKRLYDVYGQQMFDYISQKLQTPELDIETKEEMMIDEQEKETIEKITYSKSDVDKARNSGVGMKVDGTVIPTKDGGLEVTKSISESLSKITKKEITKLFESKKGKCPDSGCIQKRSKGWVVISNSTGECWGKSKKPKGSDCTYYKEKKDAQAALDAYHTK